MLERILSSLVWKVVIGICLSTIVTSLSHGAVVQTSPSNTVLIFHYDNLIAPPAPLDSTNDVSPKPMAGRTIPQRTVNKIGHIIAYTGPESELCDRAMVALQDYGHFTIDEQEAAPGQRFPYFEWTTKDGKHHKITGWLNIDTFIKNYNLKNQVPHSVIKTENTDTRVSRPQSSAYPSTSHPTWDFEGIKRPSRSFAINHLVNVHGHSRAQLESLSTDQLYAMHDADHGTTHVAKSLKRARQQKHNSYASTTDCPGGKCPSNSRGRARRS